MFYRSYILRFSLPTQVRVLTTCPKILGIYHLKKKFWIGLSLNLLLIRLFLRLLRLSWNVPYSHFLPQRFLRSIFLRYTVTYKLLDSYIKQQMMNNLSLEGFTQIRHFGCVIPNIFSIYKFVFPLTINVYVTIR